MQEKMKILEMAHSLFFKNKGEIYFGDNKLSFFELADLLQSFCNGKSFESMKKDNLQRGNGKHIEVECID